MATVEDLDMDSLVRILTEPKNALTKQYARMFEMDDVELVFTPDSLDEIAAQAIKRGTGARGLRSILEEVLLNTMYDLPSRTDIEQVLIDRDVVAEKVNPTLVPVRSADRPAEKSA
jgi:ATP-dependent Clp protease ATP-binding subunit ClpX